MEEKADAEEKPAKKTTKKAEKTAEKTEKVEAEAKVETIDLSKKTVAELKDNPAHNWIINRPNIIIKYGRF